MATLIKTTAGTWKAIIRKRGWPSTFKNFRTKRDAQDWARRTEDEMVRGIYIDRADAERMTLAIALKRYSEEVTVTKSSTTIKPERNKMRRLLEHLGDYSLAAITPNIIADYRDSRLAPGPHLQPCHKYPKAHPGRGSQSTLSAMRRAVAHQGV